MQFDRVSEHSFVSTFIASSPEDRKQLLRPLLSVDSINVDQWLAETMEILKDQAEELGFGHNNLSSVIQIVENITRSKPASLRFKMCHWHNHVTRYCLIQRMKPRSSRSRKNVWCYRYQTLGRIWPDCSGNEIEVRRYQYTPAGKKYKFNAICNSGPDWWICAYLRCYDACFCSVVSFCLSNIRKEICGCDNSEWEN